MFCLILVCSILVYSFSMLQFLYRVRLYQKTDFPWCKVEFHKIRKLLVGCFVTSCFVSVNCRWVYMESLLLHSKLQSWRLQWLLWFPRVLLPWRIRYSAWSSTALWSLQRPWGEGPTDSRNREPFLWNPQGHTSSSRQPHQISACCPWPAVVGQPHLEAVAPAVLLIPLSVLLLWLWLRKEPGGGAFRINKLQFPCRKWNKRVWVADLNHAVTSLQVLVCRRTCLQTHHCSRREFWSGKCAKRRARYTFSGFIIQESVWSTCCHLHLQMGRLSTFCR